MKKEFYNQNEDILGLRLVMCGHETCIPDFKMPVHLRGYYLIHYIQKGTLIFEENQRKHKLKEGDIFVIYPDTLNNYYSADFNISLEFCWIGFMGDTAEKYLEYAGIKRDNPIAHISNTDFADTILKLVTLFEKKNAPSEIELNSLLLRCFHSIEKSIKPISKERINYVDTVLTYIDANYMKDISASDIAEFAKLNRSYLFKIFKQQTGLSVSKYLIKYRINKACEFFKEYGFTISQVAQMVGVDDIYYFSKLFKKVTGITPSEYKKMNIRT